MCSLICLQRTHEPIPLPDGVSVTVGRTPQTRIIDPRCSRAQVSLTANWSKREIKVKQLASNNSSINGSDIGQSKEAVLNVDSTLFILSGQYPHQVVFDKTESDGVASDGASKGKESQSSASQQSSEKVSSSKEGKSEVKKTVKRPSHDQSSEQAKKKRPNSPSVKREKSKKEEEGDKRNHKSTTATKSSSISNSSKSSLDTSQRGKEDKNNGDTESEHLKNIEAKLNRIKLAAKHGSSSSPSSSKDRSHSHNSSSSKRKSSSSPSESPLSKSSKTSSTSSSAETTSEPSKTNSEPTTDAVWNSHEHLFVFTSKGVLHRKKIAGFDIDGTIIVTKSGKTFPTDSSDWKITFPEIFGKLKSLHKEGYKIVFFTNQLGVTRGKVKIEDLKTKIENIIGHLHVPVQVFIATHGGKYRKPMDGMWKRMKSQYNGGVSIDVSSSVYVGDAAGRPADWEPKKKKDFSNSDRLFALNVGLKFYTPEEYFLKRKAAKFNMPAFDPRTLPSKGDWIPKDAKLTLDTKEIILLVGFPACGKSHFAKIVLKPKGYVIVNRDMLGSWQKCVKMAQESVVNASVVVDNTNLTPEERARYTKLAQQAGVPCRCFVFNATVEHCRHNERFREMTDKSHAVINEMVFNKVKSTYREPNLGEGFTEIVKVSFVPKFSSSSLELDYRKFLLEK